MRVTGHRPLPLLAVASVLLGLMSTGSALAAGGYPVAALSLPGGLNVTGTVAVEATGSVNPGGSDTAKTLGLYVDGVASGAAHGCDTSQKSCAATLSWDSTGLSGAHQLTVKLATTGGANVTSAATTASVTSPAPTVSVTSPLPAAQVAGFVSVTGTGVIDPSQTDSPQSLQFYVDGSYSSQKSCSGGVPSCSATFSWDTTTLYGVHALQVRLRTGNGVAVLSPAVNVQVGDPPAAHLSSPAAGSVVTGVVTVTGGGTVDDLQPDAVKSLQLLVDGTLAGTVGCTGSDAAACSGRLPWDSTGAAGEHQLQLRLVTVKGQSALSAIVVVTADNPAPSVVLTASSTVVGTASVQIRGTVDPSQTDAGALVRLLADGRSVGTANCPAASKSCAVAVAWDTRGLAGQHTLQAQFTTTGGRTATSAVSQVWVFSAVKVSLSKPADAVVGRTGTITGRVVAANGSAAAGVKVRVVVLSSLGRGGTDVTVTTGPGGGFSVPYKAVSNSTVSAGVLASAHYGAGTTTARVTIAAAPSCTVRTPAVHGAPDPVVCRLGDVTRGTTVSLQSQRGGSWRTLTTAKSTGATWAFSQVFAAKGTVWVRVVVAASRDLGAAAGEPVRVAVR